MQAIFDSELDKLKKRIIKMLNLTDTQLDKAFQVLMNKEIEFFDLIRDDENKIDKMDIKIDLMCQKLFALSQPVASDLRFIMGALSISNEVERIGDMAYDLSKNKLVDTKFVEFLSKYNIPEILDKIRKLFHQIIESHSNANSELAYKIISECKSLRSSKDTLNNIAIEISQNADILVIATDLILIVNRLDRIIGHIENIGESIVFIVDGKIVKHPNIEMKK